MQHMKHKFSRWIVGGFLAALVVPAWAQEGSCDVDSPADASSWNNVSRKYTKPHKGLRAPNTVRKAVHNASVFVYPAQVVAVRGEVFLLERGGQVLSESRALKVSDALSQGDVIQTRPKSFLSLRFGDGTTNTLPANTKIKLLEAAKGVPRVALLGGAVESRVKKSPNAQKNTFEIQLPAITVGVRGTHFTVAMNDNKQNVSVTDGVVRVQNRLICKTAIAVAGGQGLNLSSSTTAPVALLEAPQLDPDSQVQRDAQRLIFNMTPVAGAVAYRAQVAYDEAFLDIGQEVTGSTTRLAVDQDRLQDRYYYVRLSAIDETGLEGKTKQYLFFRTRQLPL